MRSVSLSALQYAGTALQRSVARAASNRVLTHRAWRQIAASQRRLRRHISGGAADPLNAKIRAALAAKTLPSIEARAWAGKAPGHRRCACCAALITAGEPEYEPRGQTDLYAHLACFTAWRDESARLAQPRDASPDTAVAGE